MATGTAGLNGWRDKILRDVRRRRIAREHYPGNVRLLGFVVLGAMLWYYAHIEPMLRGTTLLGTPLTIWAAVRVLQSWLPKDSRWSEDPNATSRRVLAQPYARQSLYAAASLVAVLLLTTSSIYLRYDERQGDGDYEVEIYRGDNLLMAPQKVTSYKSLSGQAYFLQVTPLFRPWQLRLQVKQPPYRYASKTLTVRFPWSYRVGVPTWFPEKTYRIFRVLPDGEKFMNISPRKNDPLDAAYRLEAVLLQEGGREVKLFQTPYFFEPVYFGGSRDMIAFFQNAERDAEDRSLNIVGYLNKKEGLDSIARNTKAQFLLSSETVCETRQIDEDAKIVFRALLQDPTTKAWTVESTTYLYDVEPAGGIQNIYLPN